MTHVSTTTTFEVEIDLSGSYSPGYAPTRDDPGCDGEVDGVEVDGVYALKHRMDRVTFKSKWDRFDILEGLDRAARDQIAANIIAFLGDEAEDLIAGEARS